MPDFKYFVRTIGDYHDNFISITERSLSNINYQETARSNLAEQIFPCFIKHTAVSIIYTGICDKYFATDQMSSLDPKTGMRFLSPELEFIKRAINFEHDEVWINLSKVSPQFITIHHTKLSQKLNELDKILKSYHVPIYKLDYVNSKKAMEDINKIFNESSVRAN